MHRLLALRLPRPLGMLLLLLLLMSSLLLRLRLLLAWRVSPQPLLLS